MSDYFKGFKSNYFNELNILLQYCTNFHNITFAF